jgi:hypothetical protein
VPGSSSYETREPCEKSDPGHRRITLAETELLRNLDQEFRGNGLPDEPYSRLVRNGAVMHMKNTCSPAPGQVKNGTPPWAVQAAAATGAGATVRAGALKARTVHQTSSKELVEVLGHRCLRRL